MEHLSELGDFIDSLDEKNGSLIAVLHKAQEIYGYISKEMQAFIAKKLEISVAKVYGVVTFYSYFSLEKKGEFHISVCTGTACFVRGADSVTKEFEKKLEIKQGETSKDGKFSLDCLRCVGACGLAPVVTASEKVYGRVTPEDAAKIIDELESSDNE